MKVTVFGANGKVGSRIIYKLLADNIDVIAFVHNHNLLPDHPKLKIIKGDIKNLEDIDESLKNAVAIISALGSWGTKSKNIQTTGIQNIIPLAEKYKIKKIVSLTGAGSFVDDQKPNLINRLGHFGFSIFFKKILVDGEEHIKLLQKSSLDWSVIRSPVMNEWGDREYRLVENEIMPWKTINRDAVAHAMVKLLKESSYSKKAPFITR